MTRHSETNKHRATVEWDGRYWVATPESGGVTQARRLDQLPARLAEVMHLMTGEDVDPSDVDLDVRYDDDELGRQAAELRDRRVELEASAKELAELTAATARALRKRGMNLRDIGKLTGVSSTKGCISWSADQRSPKAQSCRPKPAVEDRGRPTFRGTAYGTVGVKLHSGDIIAACLRHPLKLIQISSSRLRRFSARPPYERPSMLPCARSSTPGDGWSSSPCSPKTVASTSKRSNGPGAPTNKWQASAIWSTPASSPG
jgi:hypothetical protein